MDEWKAQAQCRRGGPLDNLNGRRMTIEEWGAFIDKLFFPRRGEHTQPAKDICAICPVSAECLAEATDKDHLINGYVPHGIWGGKTYQARNEMLHAPRRSQNRPL